MSKIFAVIIGHCALRDVAARCRHDAAVVLLIYVAAAYAIFRHAATRYAVAIRACRLLACFSFKMISSL